MSFWSKLFKKEEISSSLDTPIADNVIDDWTDTIVCNSDITTALYFNEAKGLKLAGGLARVPIDVPLDFMGIPSIVTDNDKHKEIIDSFGVEYRSILLQSHRDSNIWIMPFYNSKTKEIEIEFIEDKFVKVYKDIETGALDSIKVVQDIVIKDTNDKDKTVTKIRVYTDKTIETTFKNSQVPGLKDSISRNVIGMLPIHFPNMPNGGSVRGKSDYARLLPLLQEYHRTSLRRSIELNNFKTKLIQTCGNVDSWLQNQGYKNLTDFAQRGSVENMTLILNGKDEKTEILTAKGMIDGYNATLEDLKNTIIMTSGVHQLFWGETKPGNHATAEDAMTTLINMANRKRSQSNKSFVKLFTAILKLKSILRAEKVDYKIVISWTDLDAVSDETRATIFKSFCEAMATIWNAGAITVEQLYNLWEKNFPGLQESTLEEFEKKLIRTMKFLQMKKQDYEDDLGMGIND